MVSNVNHIRLSGGGGSLLYSGRASLSLVQEVNDKNKINVQNKYSVFFKTTPPSFKNID